MELTGWDIYEIAREDTPYPSWKKIREESPILDLGDGVFFVTRWDLVNQVLRDSRLLAGDGVIASFGGGDGMASKIMRAWLMSLDGAPHNRARGLFRRQFTPQTIDSMREFIGEVADRMICEIESTRVDEPFDLFEALAFALPSEVIRILIGIDSETWKSRLEPALRTDRPQELQGAGMIEEIARVLKDFVGEGNTPEGLLQRLQVSVPEFGSLSTFEVVANGVLLITAAVDTTAGLIGNSIRFLLERPEVVARIREDPQLVSAAVEETLRFEPSALSCSRYAPEAISIAGVDIPAGSQLLLSLGAANRDPDRYSHPDDFDIDRDQSGILSFGAGRHFCLGAGLARAEAQIAVERLLVSGTCDYTLVGPAVWNKQNPTVRVLEQLLVQARPRH